MTSRLLLAALAFAAASPARAAAPSDAEVAAAYRTVDGFLPYLHRRTEDPPARVELGRKLFFEPRLSSNGALACANCHQPAQSFTDGLARARGFEQRELRRNTPTLLNVDYVKHFFWDGRADSVEQALLSAIQDPTEMNQPLGALFSRLEALPEYADGFAGAFGSPGVTEERLGQAIAAYVRTLPPPDDSPFDRGRADPGALTAAQKRGLVLFAGKARCVLCHQGADLTDGTFHNIGLAARADDPGRAGVVPSAPQGAFRTPSLRNLSRTAPYMHDGSLPGLEAVVAYFDRGGGSVPGRDPRMKPLGLSAAERADLTAFLGALDGSTAAVIVPFLPLPAAEAMKTAASVKREAAPVRPAAPAPEAPAPTLHEACAAPGLDRIALALGKSESTEETLGALLSHYEYRALERGSVEPCAVLASAHKAFSGEDVRGDAACREWYHEFRLMRELADPGPDFMAVCRESVSHMPSMDDASAAAVCGEFAKSPRRPAAACARLAPRFLAPRHVAACENGLRPLEGDAAACPPMEGRSRYDARCRGLALFAQARRGGDPSVCGGSEICRALSGEAGILAEASAEALRRRVCAEEGGTHAK